MWRIISADGLDVDGNVTVEGYTTLAAMTCNGQADFNTLTTIGGISAESIIVTGNPGTLNAGNSLLWGTLQVDGFTQLANADIAGYVTVGGNVGASTLTVDGTATIGNAVLNGYTYIGNDGNQTPSGPGNTYGALGSNMTNSNGELDFVNLGFSEAVPSATAFDWYIMRSGVQSLLMRMLTTGSLLVTGLLNATAGITTTTLTATSQSTLANVSCQNLNVSGTITGAVQSNMEILYFNLQGSAGSVSQAMALLHNTTNTTNYSVFPSVYYGFSGSGGTYNASDTSSALNQIVITNRTSSSFHWTVD